MSDIKVGDKVFVDSDGKENNYEGLGTVVAILRVGREGKLWYQVKGYWGTFEFEPHRVTLYHQPEPSDPWAGVCGASTPNPFCFGTHVYPKTIEEALEPTPETTTATSESYRFFETLLDSADEAHPSSKLFYNELIAAGLLHAQKQKDYGKVGDPFANVRSSEEWGIPAWVGAMVRLNDKVKRLQSLARTGGLANESAIDSFRDIAVYSLIALVLYTQESSAASVEAPAA